MPELPTFTTTQAARVLGISPRTLANLVAAGFVPLSSSARLPGEWTRVSALDLLRVAILQHFQAWGITREPALALLRGTLDRYLLALVATPGRTELVDRIRGVSIVAEPCPSFGWRGWLRFADAPPHTCRTSGALTLNIDAIGQAVWSRMKARPTNGTPPAGATQPAQELANLPGSAGTPAPHI
jgi:hypothetical protein